MKKLPTKLRRETEVAGVVLNPGANMKLNCDTKNTTFDASPEQRKWIVTARSRGLPLAMYDCPLCGTGHGIKFTAETLTEKTKDYPCPGPMGACSGVVVYMDAGLEPDGASFWGCGECGNVWTTEEQLRAAIAASSS